jgi:hypothetical protein
MLLKHRNTSWLLLVAVTACADLDVVNLNDPDVGRSLGTPSEVLSLIGGSFHGWFYGNYNYNSAGLALSNTAFQHNAPWSNSGMEQYGRLPRVGFANTIADSDYAYLTRPYFHSYRAIAAVADGLRALETPEVGDGLTSGELGMARAFGRFVQGMAHATVAALFSEGFAVDETTDVSRPLTPIPYQELMGRALEYFEEAAILSEDALWTLPEGWMKAALPGPELARAARSMKARYGAAVARTPEERRALDWDAILADVDGGITQDLVLHMDDGDGWSNDVLGYGTYFGWSQLAYFIYGMADQSGSFQGWNALPLYEKNPGMDGDPVLIVTPDLRFPRGSTLEVQRALSGRYFRVNGSWETGGTWARPDRGTWRWSWYKHTRGTDYWGWSRYSQPEIRMEEMRLLTAEGLYHMGRRAEAAALVNETRVPAGLNAADAQGSNTSCVPRLPDGSCGGLFEMLKWEKRMENTFKGPMGNGWYFDSRGWGDLWKDTFLHLPLPCGEAQVLGLFPCQTFGGPGGEDAAPLSTYRWNGEG